MEYQAHTPQAATQRQQQGWESDWSSHTLFYLPSFWKRCAQHHWQPLAQSWAYYRAFSRMQGRLKLDPFMKSELPLHSLVPYLLDNVQGQYQYQACQGSMCKDNQDKLSASTMMIRTSAIAWSKRLTVSKSVRCMIAIHCLNIAGYVLPTAWYPSTAGQVWEKGYGTLELCCSYLHNITIFLL